MLILDQQTHSTHGYWFFHPLADIAEHWVAPELRTVEALEALGCFLWQIKDTPALGKHCLGLVKVVCNICFLSSLAHRCHIGKIQMIIVGRIEIQLIFIGNVGSLNEERKYRCCGIIEGRNRDGDILQLYQSENVGRQRDRSFGCLCAILQGEAVSDRLSCEALRTVITECSGEFKSRTRCQDIAVKFCHQDRIGAIAGPFLCGHKTLAVHKSVQDTHQSSSLSGEILNIQNLISGKILCAGSSLQLFFVALNGKLTTVVEKVICLIKHALFFQTIPEYLKVSGF